jgi:FtsP/CotA-like multicopper oxidase with cupredoxin domain
LHIVNGSATEIRSLALPGHTFTVVALDGNPVPHPATVPDGVIEMTFAKHNAADHGFNRWTINDVPFDMKAMKPMFHLQRGKRYRLRMHNASDDIHPMHLHRHSFEIARIAGQPTGGVIKDVAMLGGYQTMEIDFTADQPGLSLFHCHMQLHMDFGFMALFDCA